MTEQLDCSGTHNLRWTDKNSKKKVQPRTLLNGRFRIWMQFKAHFLKQGSERWQCRGPWAKPDGRIRQTQRKAMQHWKVKTFSEFAIGMKSEQTGTVMCSIFWKMRSAADDTSADPILIYFSWDEIGGKSTLPPLFPFIFSVHVQFVLAFVISHLRVNDNKFPWRYV